MTDHRDRLQESSRSLVRGLVLVAIWESIDKLPGILVQQRISTMEPSWFAGSLCVRQDVCSEDREAGSWSGGQVLDSGWFSKVA